VKPTREANALTRPDAEVVQVVARGVNTHCSLCCNPRFNSICSHDTSSTCSRYLARTTGLTRSVIRGSTLLLSLNCCHSTVFPFPLFLCLNSRRVSVCLAAGTSAMLPPKLPCESAIVYYLARESDELRRHIAAAARGTPRGGGVFCNHGAAF
jgi:hypothetical protein